MFHHDLKLWVLAADRVEHFVDKDSFAVKDVHVIVGDFAMGAKRQTDLGHFGENGFDLVKVGHT